MMAGSRDLKITEAGTLTEGAENLIPTVSGKDILKVSRTNY
jgi:hypothetical protein